MVTLKALEAAITQIETLQDHELTFEVNGLTLALRPVRSVDEPEVQRYSQIAWEKTTNADGDVAAFQDFSNRVRLGTIAFALVQIGSLDLRGVDYIETGEEDENGNIESRPKWETILELITNQWTKELQSQVFLKYGELMERIEISASKMVRFDPADLDDEITRLEKRLEDLKLKKAEQGQSTSDPAKKIQRAILKQDQQQTQVREDLRNQAQEVAKNHKPQTRQSAVPKQAPAPTRPPPAEPVHEPEIPVENSLEPTFSGNEIEDPYQGDSFLDMSDPDAAIQVEARRQALLHQQNLRRTQERQEAAQRAAELGLPTSADLARQRLRAQQEASRPRNAVNLDTRTAGLRQAANTQNQIMDSGASRIQRGGPKPSKAELHGKPVYKMPPQTLERSERGQPSKPLTLDPEVGGVQERFVPVRKP